MKFLKKLFYTPQQCHLFLMLCVTTLFDFALLALRFWKINFDFSSIHSLKELFIFERGVTFLFLVLNLFLAWMPYWISMTFKMIDSKTNSKLLLGFVFCCWLLFFPNAPYIITDLIHIKHRPPLPIWYDALLIFSFAWTGLMLGFASLMTVQTMLRKYFSSRAAGTIVLTSLTLCGFGIYLGRFQRFHSWHIITYPESLLHDITNALLHPFAHAGTLGLAVVLSGFLILGYLTVLTIISDQELS